MNVRLVGAVIEPFAEGGETWDGLGRVSAEDQAAIRRAALGTGDPYVILATVLGLIANDSWSDADVHGVASVSVGGEYLVEFDEPLDAVRDDTPNAEWVGPPGWDSAPTRTTRIRVVLNDEDVTFHDRIGTVELTAAHLEAAYRAGRVYPVPVADQGTPILFVRISVTEAPP